MASPGRCTWAWCTGWTGLPPGLWSLPEPARRRNGSAARSRTVRFKRPTGRWWRGVPDDAGTFTDYLVKGEGNLSRVARADTPGAKRAVLHYRMLYHGNNRSLVEIDLVTGRPHQIRVQFASRGMPLVGDARYGSGGRQLALYATGISLIHPTKQERMDFVSDGCENRFNRLLRG